LADESNRVYVDCWSEFIKGSQRGETIDANGLTIASSRSSWPGLNLAFLRSPIQSESDFHDRLRFGSAYFDERKLRWLLVLYTGWAEALSHREVSQFVSDRGLYLVQEVVGMSADQVTPPGKQLPPLVFKPLKDDEQVQKDFATINADANRIPEEWTQEAVVRNSIWDGPASAYVGYWKDEPATTAMTLRSDKTDFIGWVATRPMYQKEGFGEAVLRHTIAQSRTRLGDAHLMLHATADGLSLYRRLGFTECARFQLYLGGNN
jgi:ribosomal protein S18 acetylase RimI-like enzyme